MNKVSIRAVNHDHISGNQSRTPKHMSVPLVTGTLKKIYDYMR